MKCQPCWQEALKTTYPVFWEIIVGNNHSHINDEISIYKNINQFPKCVTIVWLIIHWWCVSYVSFIKYVLNDQLFCKSVNKDILKLNISIFPYKCFKRSH